MCRNSIEVFTGFGTILVEKHFGLERSITIMIFCRKEIPFYAQHKGEGAVLFAGIVMVTSNVF